MIQTNSHRTEPSERSLVPTAVNYFSAESIIGIFDGFPHRWIQLIEHNRLANQLPYDILQHIAFGNQLELEVILFPKIIPIVGQNPETVVNAHDLEWPKGQAIQQLLDLTEISETHSLLGQIIENTRREITRVLELPPEDPDHSRIRTSVHELRIREAAFIQKLIEIINPLRVVVTTSSQLPDNHPVNRVDGIGSE